MPHVGFEPKIPVYERAKKVKALDRVAAVIGHVGYGRQNGAGVGYHLANTFHQLAYVHHSVHRRR